MGSQASRDTCEGDIICRLHVFFHQYVADLREERSENVLRTVSASPFIFDMTVSSTSGVITTPPEGLARRSASDHWSQYFAWCQHGHAVRHTTGSKHRAAGDAAP